MDGGASEDWRSERLGGGVVSRSSRPGRWRLGDSAWAVAFSRTAGALDRWTAGALESLDSWSAGAVGGDCRRASDCRLDLERPSGAAEETRVATRETWAPPAPGRETESERGSEGQASGRI